MLAQRADVTDALLALVPLPASSLREMAELQMCPVERASGHTCSDTTLIQDSNCLGAGQSLTPNRD